MAGCCCAYNDRLLDCVGLSRLPGEGEARLSVDDEPLHHSEAAGGRHVRQRAPGQEQRDRGAGGHKEVSVASVNMLGTCCDVLSPSIKQIKARVAAARCLEAPFSNMLHPHMAKEKSQRFFIMCSHFYRK